MKTLTEINNRISISQTMDERFMLVLKGPLKVPIYIHSLDPLKLRSFFISFFVVVGLRPLRFHLFKVL